MISINEAKRLIKRALLANLTTKKKDLAITPLVSGKHGIGKSQMVKSIARDLGGVCITKSPVCRINTRTKTGKFVSAFCLITPWSVFRRKKSGCSSYQAKPLPTRR